MNLGDILIGQAGGVLGIPGSIGTGVLSLFQKKQDHLFELDRLKAERGKAVLMGNLKQAELAGDLATAREVGPQTRSPRLSSLTMR